MYVVLYKLGWIFSPPSWAKNRPAHLHEIKTFYLLSACRRSGSCPHLSLQRTSCPLFFLCEKQPPKLISVVSWWKAKLSSWVLVQNEPQRNHMSQTLKAFSSLFVLCLQIVCVSMLSSVISDLRNITLDLSGFLLEITSFYSSVYFCFATSGEWKTSCKHTSTFHRLLHKYGELVSKQLPFKHPAATKQH